jgi:hypothetical protein
MLVHILDHCLAYTVRKIHINLTLETSQLFTFQKKLFYNFSMLLLTMIAQIGLNSMLWYKEFFLMERENFSIVKE